MSRSRIDPSNRSGPPSSQREVNSLLHTLRGEQFRHTQNLLRSKARLTAVASRTFNDPSLPFSDIYKYAHASTEDHSHNEETVRPPLPVIREGHLEHDFPRGPVPGPPVPKSWSGLFRHDPVEDRDTIAFRREALSLIFSYTSWSFGSSDVPDSQPGSEPRHVRGSSNEQDREFADQSIPPLRQMCLKALLAQFTDTEDFRDELLPVLPPVFYRDVLRYTAVHDPLTSGKLYSLCEPEGRVDGELIVVGPQATLQRDVLVSMSPTKLRGAEVRGEEPRTCCECSNISRQDEEAGEEAEAEDSWDIASSSSQDMSPPLHTIVVLNTGVPTAMLLVFPPTIVRLALLALPVPTQVHRLPRICPLLEVLDLSYNPWLTDLSGGKSSVETILERIEWEKWARLQVLGLRECNVPASLVARVNRGRFEDEVRIIGVKERTLDNSLDAVEGMMKSLRLSD